jgi:hypothetical protein
LRATNDYPDEGAAAVKLWIYLIAGGVIAAYVASLAAKSMFGALL